MATYITRRLILTIPVLIGITLICFTFLKVTGDPCVALLGERYTPDKCAEIKVRYHLNDPVPLQYAHYMGRLLTGDLGTSIVYKTSVATELARTFPATVELALAAMLIAVCVGVPLGILAAARHNSVFDLGAMVVALTGVSVPVFWLGLMFQFVLAFKFGLFPTNGRLTTGIDLVQITHLYTLDSLLTGNWPALRDTLHHLALPALALSTIPTALIARISRSAMLDVLGRDYIRTARAKGVHETVVISRHALANAMLPVVTVIGLQTGSLLSGAVLTETIFAWPGMGRWVVGAVSSGDIPLVQGGVLVFAVVFVMVNLAVDVSYAWLDPRIRFD